MSCTAPQSVSLHVPLAVPLTPLQCFALASLLDDDRAFALLVEAVAEQGSTDDAELDAEHIANTIRSAPWAPGTPSL